MHSKWNLTFRSKTKKLVTCPTTRPRQNAVGLANGNGMAGRTSFGRAERG